MSFKNEYITYKYCEPRPHQVDCVKDLNLSYCCTARVCQVAVIITDRECAQPCDGHNNKNADEDNLSTLNNYQFDTL